MRTAVLIVGGGLAGLALARRLHAADIDFQLVEARDRLGGRILSVDGEQRPSSDGFDLGPSWFWPDSQPGLAQLLDDLGLESFHQYSEGEVVFHRMSRETPQRYRGSQQPAQSARVVGGTAALIDRLATRLPAARIHLSHVVSHVHLTAGEVEVEMEAPQGPVKWRCDQIAFALPPRLLEAGVGFTPEIAADERRLWRETPTWMAPHAKFFALYDRAFWRDKGLSGSAQSMVGPMVEIHDATTASGAPALFGFIGMSAGQRKAMGELALRQACTDQLALLFGPEAQRPTRSLYKDWCADPFTATPTDASAAGHPIAVARPWINGPWRGRACMAGSETSPVEPGYLAGAVAAADRAASDILTCVR